MTFAFKTSPFAHQLKAFNKLKDQQYGGLFFDCGLGKTKAIIDICRYKYLQAGQVLNTLIICPKIAMKNWEKEWKLHSNSGQHVVLLDGDAKKRKLKLAKANGIFVVNYAGLAVLHDVLPNMKWPIVVWDELHNTKTYSSLQTKYSHQIAERSTCRFGLTGTPILNSPIDIWGQFYCLDLGEAFGNNFFSFRNKYFYDANSGFQSKKGYFPNWIPHAWAIKEIGDVIKQKAALAHKFDCLDLPPKLYQELLIDMPPELKKSYTAMEDELIAFVEENDAPTIAANALAKNIRLMQISSGFAKLDTGNEIPFKSNTKMKEIKDLVAQLAPDAKIIVWAIFRQNIKQLFAELSDYNPVTIFGDTKDPFAAAEAFNEDPKIRVAICQPQTASEAINLTAASYAVYYSQDFSLKHRLQSEDRCHRATSTMHKNITYIDLIYKDSVDENIVEALKGKEDLSNSVLQIVGRIKERRQRNKEEL